jgi:hypothetical protein
VALDGAGRNSPFTAALARRIVERGRNLTALMIEVRKDVLKNTDGRQVPWDHSALTSDFIFEPGAEAASGHVPAADGQEIVQARLKAIEEQIRSKTDREQTLSLVKLSQLKERVRQLDEAMREDQQRIFDAYNRHPSGEADSRRNLSLEIGGIQIQMARRGQEKKSLQEQIAKLGAELGLAETADSGSK